MNLRILAIFYCFLASSASLAEVGISCLPYDYAYENRCEENMTTETVRFCRSNYGPDFLPFYDEDNCDISSSNKLAGFTESLALLEIIRVELDSIERQIREIDPLALIPIKSFRAVKKFDVSSDSIDQLIDLHEKFKKLNDRFLQLSRLKVKKEDLLKISNIAQEYFKYLISYIYLEYSTRFKISSDSSQFNFQKMQELFLVVHKSVGSLILENKEIYATSEDGLTMRLVPSNHLMSIIEYFVLSQKTEDIFVARKNGFLRMLELKNNLWSLQEHNISTLSCGDFYSLKDSKLQEESRRYEFYNNVIKPILFSDITDIYLNSYFSNGQIKREFKKFYQKSTSFKVLVDSYASEDGLSLNDHFEQTLELLKKREAQVLSDSLLSHISTLILPGDRISDNYALAKRVGKEISKIKYDMSKQSLRYIYPGLLGKDYLELEESLGPFLSKRKRTLELIIEGKILDVLQNRHEIEKEQVLTDKKEKVKKVISKNKKYLDLIKNNVPANKNELKSFLDYKISTHPDVKFTLERSVTGVAIYNEFLNAFADILDTEDAFYFWGEVLLRTYSVLENRNIDKFNIKDYRKDELVQNQLLPVQQNKNEKELERLIESDATVTDMFSQTVKGFFKDQINYVLKKDHDSKHSVELKLEIEKEILTDESLLLKLAGLLKINQIEKSLKRGSFSGYMSLKEITEYNSYMIQKLYQENPLLKLPVEVIKVVEEPFISAFGEELPFKQKVEKKVEMTLLETLMDHDENSIDQTIDSAIEKFKNSAPSEFDKACGGESEDLEMTFKLNSTESLYNQILDSFIEIPADL